MPFENWTKTSAISQIDFVLTWIGILVFILLQMNDTKGKNPNRILDNMDNTLARNVVPQDSNNATWIEIIADFSVLQRPTSILNGFFDSARQNSAEQNLSESQTYRWELAKIDAWNKWCHIKGSSKIYNVFPYLIYLCQLLNGPLFKWWPVFDWWYKLQSGNQMTFNYRTTIQKTGIQTVL